MWLERKILGRLYGEQVCVGLYVCCCLGKNWFSSAGLTLPSCVLIRDLVGMEGASRRCWRQGSTLFLSTPFLCLLASSLPQIFIKYISIWTGAALSHTKRSAPTRAHSVKAPA